MGCPRKNLPANGLQIIRALASNGVHLAKALGVDVKTWRRIREEDLEAKAAWEEARALEQDKLVGVGDNRPTININIPAPLKPEDYAKLITIAPDAVEHIA
jgi:hypothetical protein